MKKRTQTTAPTRSTIQRAAYVLATRGMALHALQAAAFIARVALSLHDPSPLPQVKASHWTLHPRCLQLFHDRGLLL